MWVVFEGLDKSGKTTLEWEFLKATNFKHIIIDRGPAGYLAFDFIFGRATIEGNKQYGRNVGTMAASGEFIVVYCRVPANIAMQRLKEYNETCPYDYERAQGVYDEVVKRLYKETGINVLTIDTTMPIKECIQMIIEKLEEAQKREL